MIVLMNIRMDIIDITERSKVHYICINLMCLAGLSYFICLAVKKQ